jgi:hypothetical protein
MHNCTKTLAFLILNPVIRTIRYYEHISALISSDYRAFIVLLNRFLVISLLKDNLFNIFDIKIYNTFITLCVGDINKRQRLHIEQ